MEKDFSHAWLEALQDILTCGNDVAPRDQPTKEILQRTMQINMRKPVLMIPTRKLSYQFMAAEAYWILTGDDRVETISPYNKRIADFSDDGKTFFGAYGPKIRGQLDYVVEKLLQDSSSRQAGLTIWRENPPPTKDIPCTIAVFFNIRDGKLNCHNFMRSSDIWLGIPYDVFNFSMLSHLVCASLNSKGCAVTPGTLYLTAASSHLYERNFEAAHECLGSLPTNQNETPEILYGSTDTALNWLRALRDTKPGDVLRWWEVSK